MKEQIKYMRLVSVLEGTTLILLVFIAVPIKYWAGYPEATKVMGPIHGIAFILYFVTLVQTVSSGGWTRYETTRLMVAAIIPFGAFLNDHMLRNRLAKTAGEG